MKAEIERTGDDSLSVHIAWSDEGNGGPAAGPERIEFAGLPIGADPSPDFLLPLLLLPAMAAGEDLVVPAAVSPRRQARVAQIQSIFATWFPQRLAPVAVRGEGGSQAAPGEEGRPERLLDRKRGAAAFFSGGVDSFHTALELGTELDALIHVTGFDHGIGRETEPSEAQILRQVGEAAARLNLPLIQIRTSLRRFSDELVLWGDHYVGSAMATIALLLAPLFSRVYVPATHTYADLFPYGTHPLTDPLWSTEATEIRLHGCDLPRPAKIVRVAQSEVALDTLRVCWENVDGSYNCGRCRKCLLTQVSLALCGTLERCKTLPHTIDMEAMSRVVALDRSGEAFVRMARDALRESTDPRAEPIEQMLGSALSGSEGVGRVR